MSGEREPSSDPEAGSAAEIPRRQMLRDLLVFQGKLLLDALRDLILSPAAIVTGGLGLVLGGRATALFYELVRLGRRLDEWINLFGAAQRIRPEPGTAEAGGPGVDGLIEGLEELVHDYRQGGLSRHEAKERALEVLKSRHPPHQ